MITLFGPKGAAPEKLRTSAWLRENKSCTYVIDVCYQHNDSHCNHQHVK